MEKQFELPHGITSRLKHVLDDKNAHVTEIKFDFPLDRGGVGIESEPICTPYGVGYVKHLYSRYEKRIVINAKIEITETVAKYLGILK
jgi:hypothetical protein